MLSDEQNLYLDKFHELEDLLVKGKNKGFSDILNETKNIFAQEDYAFLRTCNYVRNILSHGKQENFIIPTPYLIQRLDKVIQTLTKTAWDISTKNIYFKRVSDPLLPTLKDMKEKIYTHVPILDDNGLLVGVLSESSIFNYIANQEEIILDLRDSKISDLINELNIKRSNESFEFVPRNMPMIELKDMFYKKIENKERLGAIFVTENGKTSEKILGIITSWDMCSF